MSGDLFFVGVPPTAIDGVVEIIVTLAGVPRRVSIGHAEPPDSAPRMWNFVFEMTPTAGPLPALPRRTMAKALSSKTIDPLEQQADAAMSRHAEGDPSAFVELYDALSPSLYRFIRQLTNNRTLSEDLLQQTFLHMHNKRMHFILGAPVKPWAFAIARRLFIDHYRRSKRELLPKIDIEVEHHDGTNPESWHLASEDATLAAEQLHRLPPAQREAYLLVKAEGMSPAEAARLLGITSIAVRVRVHRAVSALRSVLGIGQISETGGES